MFIFFSFLYFLFAPLIPFAVLHFTRTRVWFLVSLNIITSQYSPRYYCLSTHRFLVIAVILLVTVAHASVAPRPPHFLEKVFVLKNCATYYSANLGSWLVARGEGWAHQRFSPPARGLVLKIVIIRKSSLRNGFGNIQSESLPSPLQLCSTRVSSTCSTLPHFSTLLNCYLPALIMAGL